MENINSIQKEIKEKLFLILFLFILVNLASLKDLMQVWSSNEDYGHGFVILPISLYLIWKKRELLLDQPVRLAWWGWLVTACWITTYMAGTIGDISTLSYISMVLFPIGAAAVLISGSAVKLIIFPVMYLLFMFPIPSEIYTRITNPLMLISTGISFHLLGYFPIPLLQEGNLLTLPNYAMQVVNACSGIRSLLMITALALITGYIMTPSNVLRVVFFCISIPIAILGNVIRISTTVLLAYYCSPRIAEGFAHTFAGIVVFVISLIFLYSCMEVILWFSSKRAQPSSS